MPAAHFTHTVTSSATNLDQAWAGLQDPLTWATVAGITEVSNATFDGGGNLTGYLFTAVVAGKEYAGKADVRLSSRPTDMVVHISTSEIAGTIAANLVPGQDGVRVTITLDLQTRGLLAAMMFPLITGAIRNGLPEQVHQFAAHLAA